MNIQLQAKSTKKIVNSINANKSLFESQIAASDAIKSKIVSNRTLTDVRAFIDIMRVYVISNQFGNLNQSTSYQGEELLDFSYNSNLLYGK